MVIMPRHTEVWLPDNQCLHILLYVCYITTLANIEAVTPISDDEMAGIHLFIQNTTTLK